MKEKYHISYDGVARKCNATVNPCPLGEHYSSLQDARDAAREQNKKDYSIMPAVESEPRERGPLINFNPDMYPRETIEINASILANWFKGSIVVNPKSSDQTFRSGNLINIPNENEFVYSEWFAENENIPEDWIAQTTERLNSLDFRKGVYIHLYDEFKEVVREYYKMTEED